MHKNIKTITKKLIIDKDNSQILIRLKIGIFK